MNAPKKAKIEQFAVIGLLMLFALILAGSLKKSGLFSGKQQVETEQIIQGTMPEMIKKARDEADFTADSQMVTLNTKPEQATSFLQYKYMASNGRDPLQSLFPKPEQPEETSIEEEPVELVEENVIPVIPSLLVEGMIWGGSRSQAIINSKVYDVGDMVEGGKIISIERDGVKIDFNGYVVSLDASDSKAKDVTY